MQSLSFSIAMQPTARKRGLRVPSSLRSSAAADGGRWASEQARRYA